MFLVFVKDEFIRGAEAMTGGKVNWDSDDVDNEIEIAYRDIEAPALILMLHNATDITDRIRAHYPNADPNVFEVFDTTSCNFSDIDENGNIIARQ